MVSLILIVHIVFGFATNKPLKAVKNTNAGLRDQRAAFECEYISSLDIMAVLIPTGYPGVRDNIAPFGGDSGNIVAVGQSVGASSIGLHIVSYDGTQGVPFHKAM